jgi:hypothetical protein
MLFHSTFGGSRPTNRSCLDGCPLHLSIFVTQTEICSNCCQCCLIPRNQNWELSVGVAGTKFTNPLMGRRRQIRPLFDPSSEGAAENRQEFEGVDFAGTLLAVAHGSFVQVRCLPVTQQAAGSRPVVPALLIFPGENTKSRVVLSCGVSVFLVLRGTKAVLGGS